MPAKIAENHNRVTFLINYVLCFCLFFQIHIIRGSKSQWYTGSRTLHKFHSPTTAGLKLVSSYVPEVGRVTNEYLEGLGFKLCLGLVFFLSNACDNATFIYLPSLPSTIFHSSSLHSIYSVDTACPSCSMQNAVTYEPNKCCILPSLVPRPQNLSPAVSASRKGLVMRRGSGPSSLFNTSPKNNKCGGQGSRIGARGKTYKNCLECRLAP